ncbi:uncharacterized protein N7500_006154 [Penicillium coprophilum]|uniref:uncharacterized protein n=1 Tax=Penicillium coprophilum TaxID=36646 RepID=UPI0023A52E29|nr:uncharacterized protein N7500_006154 [Penicillium coprophilum]KAJ5164324.1 hypothetical protein N7500_006154 [Penicillium coprophilum]
MALPIIDLKRDFKANEIIAAKAAKDKDLMDVDLLYYSEFFQSFLYCPNPILILRKLQGVQAVSKQEWRQ